MRGNTGSPQVEVEVFREVYDADPGQEPCLRHLSVTLGHAIDGLAEVVILVLGPDLGHLHTDTLARCPGHSPDGLEHRVQDRTGEVLFRVRQPLGRVGAGSSAQGQVALAL
jgi:hypothetical protein